MESKQEAGHGFLRSDKLEKYIGGTQHFVLMGSFCTDSRPVTGLSVVPTQEKIN